MVRIGKSVQELREGSNGSDWEYRFKNLMELRMVQIGIPVREPE